MRSIGLFRVFLFDTIAQPNFDIDCRVTPMRLARRSSLWIIQIGKSKAIPNSKGSPVAAPGATPALRSEAEPQES